MSVYREYLYLGPGLRVLKPDWITYNSGRMLPDVYTCAPSTLE